MSSKGDPEAAGAPQFQQVTTELLNNLFGFGAGRSMEEAYEIFTASIVNTLISSLPFLKFIDVRWNFIPGPEGAWANEKATEK